jgi:hypothetical protein
MSFDRNYLTIQVDTDVELRAPETVITATQVCLMRSMDRNYTFVNPLPTKGLEFSMRLGANIRDTVFSDVTVTADSYHDLAARNVRNTLTEPHTFTRHIDGWFFPGSAITVEWTDA